MDKKIRLAIDGNEANVKERVGSNIYALEMLSAIKDLAAGSRKWQVTVILSAEKLPDLPSESWNFKYRLVKPKFFFTQLALPLHLYWHQSDYDVFYTPGHYAPRFCPIPYISSVMDLGFLKYPEQFLKKDRAQLTIWTKQSVEGATKVATISEFSKKDIERYYHRDSQDIVVAYPAAKIDPYPNSQDVGQVLDKYRLENYFIYVGTIQPRKNITKLLLAFEKLCREISAENLGKKKVNLPQLVLTGKVGWLADPILTRIKASPFFNQIRLTGFVTDKEKYALIKGAKALILVGTYEGFGIPPLEAMTLGTPAIVANATSLPEVVGHTGFLVNPQSVTSIARQMKSVMKLTKKQQQALSGHMKKQIKKFNYHLSANIILQELETIAQK